MSDDTKAMEYIGLYNQAVQRIGVLDNEVVALRTRIAELEGVASGLKASLDSVTAAWDKEFKATEALEAQLAAALQRAEAAKDMARWLRSPIDQVGSWTCECCGAYNEHVAPEPERHKADCPVGRYRAASGGQG